jgi:amino acid permease
MLVSAMENNDRGAAAGPMSYGKLAKEVHSTAAQKAAAWAVILQQFGACVAYIVIIADVIQPIAGLQAAGPGSLLCDRALYQVGPARQRRHRPFRP